MLDDSFITLLKQPGSGIGDQPWSHTQLWGAQAISSYDQKLTRFIIGLERKRLEKMFVILDCITAYFSYTRGVLPTESSDKLHFTTIENVRNTLREKVLEINYVYGAADPP